MIKIGDRIKFLSDTGVGVVTKIDNDILWVEVDGFEVPTSIRDVVAVSKEQELETLAKLGADDERPGSKKAKHQAKKDRTQPKEKETEVYRRYGKISLVADEECEDEEDILDLYDIKEKYVKNLLAAQKREREIEHEEVLRAQNKARTIETGSSKQIEEDLFAPKELIAKQKLKTITLDELGANKNKEKITIKQVLAKSKKENEIEVIDLHAHEIMDSTNGLSNGEIITAQLSRFTISLDSHIKSTKHGKIIYIHGVGTRKLRSEIERKLKISYPKLSFQDASFKEYGFGAILIMF